MYAELIPPWLLIAYAIVLGPVMGSFLTCFAWRLIHGESVLRGRSHCDACGHVLGPLDLVPVLSWVALKGRCRYCGKHISAACPLTEIICAAAYATLVWRYGFSADTLRFIFLASILLMVSLVDMEGGWIPDRFLIAGAVFWLLTLFLDMSTLKAQLLQGLLGAAALFIPLLFLVLIADKLLKKESMGGGDLKLYALLGLYFGWQQGLLLVILSGFTGIMFAAMIGKAKFGKPFPFAPAMAAAAWVTAVWGQHIMSWYLSLFGL